MPDQNPTVERALQLLEVEAALAIPAFGGLRGAEASRQPTLLRCRVEPTLQTDSVLKAEPVGA